MKHLFCSKMLHVPMPWMMSPLAMTGPLIGGIDVGHDDVPRELAGARLERDQTRFLRRLAQVTAL